MAPPDGALEPKAPGGAISLIRARGLGGKRTQQDCYFAVMVQLPSDLIWTKPGVSWTVPL
jgi:hypothetical protein